MIPLPRHVTPVEFRAVLLKAVEHIHVIRPVELQEPLRTWFRGHEERARLGQWPDLLGRSVTTVWNAAMAVLRTAGAAGD